MSTRENNEMGLASWPHDLTREREQGKYVKVLPCCNKAAMVQVFATTELLSDESREGRHHDEEDDELSTRVVSDFTGDARMRRMVGFWGKDYFRDSQTRSLPMGSLYFCVELP